MTSSRLAAEGGPSSPEFVHPDPNNDNVDTALPGSASLKFRVRRCLVASRRAAALDVIVLAFSISSVFLRVQGRPGAPLAVGCQVPMLAYAAVVLANLTWLHLGRRSAPSSYAKFAEAASLLLRIGWFGCEAAMALLQRHFLEPGGSGSSAAGEAGELPGSGGSGTEGLLLRLGMLSHHALHLSLASSALCMLAQMLRPMRLSLSIAAQGLLLAISARRAPDVCATGPLAQPAAQRLTHRLFRRLSFFAYLSPMPMSPMVAGGQLEAAAQCTALLRFLQGSVGLLLPLVWQAFWESRLFALHQRQRRLQGLPPERGVSAWLYTTAAELSHHSIRPYLYLLAAIILGTCFDLCAVLSSSAASAGS